MNKFIDLSHSLTLKHNLYDENNFYGVHRFNNKLYYKNNDWRL